MKEKIEICINCKELQVYYKFADSALCIPCYYAVKYHNMDVQMEKLRKDCEELTRMNDLKNFLHRGYCKGCEKKMRELTPEEKEQFNNTTDLLSEEHREWAKNLFKKFKVEKIDEGVRENAK